MSYYTQFSVRIHNFDLLFLLSVSYSSVVCCIVVYNPLQFLLFMLLCFLYGMPFAPISNNK